MNLAIRVYALANHSSQLSQGYWQFVFFPVCWQYHEEQNIFYGKHNTVKSWASLLTYVIQHKGMNNLLCLMLSWSLIMKPFSFLLWISYPDEQVQLTLVKVMYKCHWCFVFKYFYHILQLCKQKWISSIVVNVPIWTQIRPKSSNIKGVDNSVLCWAW